MTEGEVLPQASAVKTIALGGLAIGVLDAIDAMAFWWFYAEVSPVRVWQAVAAGLLGREAAVAGGLATSALGLFLHFVIAFVVAATYYLLTRLSGFLVRHPVVSGLIYGVIVNFVMQYVVIPLSAAPGTAPFRLPVFLNSVIGHALFVGLPVALIASWSAKRNSID